MNMNLGLEWGSAEIFQQRFMHRKMTKIISGNMSGATTGAD
jgi:hypothetical protein